MKNGGEHKMKKIDTRRFLLASLLVLTVSVLVSAVIIPSIAFAAKPTANLASAQKVDWNLSAAVMPVPPYGSRDIPGSDTASKLIVNQPNGNIEVTITGAMNGLNPNTPYTVYLSKGYDPYTGWPGLFTSTVPAFTFVTDAYGAGSWHVNLRDANFPESGIHTLSVWINEAGLTMLISGNFEVISEID